MADTYNDEDDDEAAPNMDLDDIVFTEEPQAQQSTAPALTAEAPPSATVAQQPKHQPPAAPTAQPPRPTTAVPQPPPRAAATDTGHSPGAYTMPLANSAQVPAASATAGPSSSADRTLMYWIDAKEDNFSSPGVVYMFGKTWDAKAVCALVLLVGQLQGTRNEDGGANLPPHPIPPHPPGFCFNFLFQRIRGSTTSTLPPSPRPPSPTPSLTLDQMKSRAMGHFSVGPKFFLGTCGAHRGSCFAIYPVPFLLQMHCPSAHRQPQSNRCNTQNARTNESAPPAPGFRPLALFLSLWCTPFSSKLGPPARGSHKLLTLKHPSPCTQEQCSELLFEWIKFSFHVGVILCKRMQ